MSAYDSDTPDKRSLTQDLWYAARYYLGGRTGIIVAGAAALGVSAFFNWGWLVAIGVAPLLLTALPCAAMCALGLCMKGGSKPSGDGQTPQGTSAGDTTQSPTLRLAATDETAGPAGESKNQEKNAAPPKRKGCC